MSIFRRAGKTIGTLSNALPVKLLPIIILVLLLSALVPQSGTKGAALAASATSASCPSTIQMGSTGDLVKKLQNDLNAQYQQSAYATEYGNSGNALVFDDKPNDFKPPLMVDGQFGPLTQNAVEDFQEAAHLDPDGQVGPLTWGALGEC